jgi:TRAP-type C4-dicarboxylate transport system substrate-binding protein
MFPGGSLIPSPQAYDGVIKGIADIAMSFQGFTRGRFPLTEVIDLPLAWKSGRSATQIVNELYAKFQPKEYNDVKVMYLHAHGPGIVNSKKPINKLEDMKGLKFRCTGTSAEVVKHLGGTPVAMAQNETYDALQKGVVDGVMSPIETMKGWKFAEVVKASTLNYGSAYSLGFFVVMNKAKWNALPKDVQATITKINEEWIEKTAKAWDTFDKEGLELTKAKVNQVITLSKQEDERWAGLVKPIMNDWVQKTKTKGLPGDEALKFCLDWLKKNQ